MAGREINRKTAFAYSGLLGIPCGAPVLDVDVTTGQWVLIAAVLLALTFGGWRAMVNGRFRTGSSAGVEQASRLAGTDFADQLGERATLLQFSSAFCAPCRATRRILAEVAELVPGVAHVEVDAESQLELVRRLDILRTPTTVVLDARGVEVTRAAGAPTKEQVLAALDGAISH